MEPYKLYRSVNLAATHRDTLSNDAIDAMVAVFDDLLFAFKRACGMIQTAGV
ncbi:uncharacterized protein PHALS_00168 [Plasmopara halstedii]|uniref:Uncharacterized protein n=1 Tax=Plasmopara halstedii TaxID=4781 RepID=A0A0P1A5J2_PLAHL|nr:uncharacterized protein PHALS_00168 [Plasmopara halstedii]CEG35839.1 hypothetical protein PHALS_00168 [Plasmopara halstedii]|eukprot:XP_024572208.1 hypothetical protein PHALS_00168 [Plasmopara halstedii]